MATQSSLRSISQVLISVSDKAGIVEFASELHKHGVNILSTGGTARLLAEKDIPVTEIADYTGFPEMMDGRVKTLHPKIHGGILGRRGQDDDVMQHHDIPPIDMVVVNLYPFAQTIANESCSIEEAIENIDIGGPTMLRSSAKNHRDVTVVVDPHDYQRILDEMDEHDGSVTFTTRQTLAKKVFEHTAHYDGLIAGYMGSLENDGSRRQFSDTLNLQFHKAQDMRYGENPHQQAAFYREASVSESCVASAGQLQGKALSYNNIADTDTAFECVKEFETPACVIVKHANPCGVATSGDILSAYELAFATDPTSSFGGIIAFNRKLDAATAKAIIDRQFVEVIIAPEVADDAKPILASKKNVRVLVSGPINAIKPSVDYKRVTGGILVQDKDIHQINPSELATATSRAPSDQELSDCLFAWKVCKYVKSNAIVYAGKNQTIGIGAGQMSRVYSAKIAQIKAADENLTVAGSVMASDAFFPFRDSVDLAHEAGVTAIIQPGGSIRDPEVIEAANEHNIAMLFTGIRHFKH